MNTIMIISLKDSDKSSPKRKQDAKDSQRLQADDSEVVWQRARREWHKRVAYERDTAYPAYRTRQQVRG